jgi:hypothetical protein
MFDPSDPSDDPHSGGRPPVLDEEKRRKIIAMLANGSSRRVAANQAFEQLDALVREIRIDPKKADVPYSPQLPEPKWPEWGYEKAPHANGGSFATDPPNGLYDFDEDQSSQVFVVEAVQIVPNQPSQTAA